MTDREKKIQALLALQEIQRRKSFAPLAYMKWHPGQIEANRLKKEKRGLLLNCGNRWGKSKWNGSCSAAHAYGYWIWDVPGLKLEDGDYPPRSRIDPGHWIRRPDGVPIRVPNRGLMVTGLNRERGLGGILFPALEESLPPTVRSRWKVQRGPLSVASRCVLPNGSEIYFGSSEQEPMHFEGMSFDWVGCDEPVPRAVWGAIWRGMTDFFSPFWWTMTPLGRNAPFAFEEFVKTERQDVARLQGSIWDNPYVPHEAKVSFLEDGNYSEEEAGAREKGSWSFMSHRAFPTFDPAAHVIPPRHLDPAWARMLVIDPAHRRPYAMLWLAFGPNDEVIVYDEWPPEDHSKIRSSSYSIRDYATLIRNKEGGQRTDFRVLDPRFGKAEFSFKNMKHTSVQTDFAELGLFFDCSVPDTGREETGIQRIRELLAYDRSHPLSEMNRPKLRVFSTCRNTIDSLALSNFAPPAARDSMNLPEKLVELYKDFRDCLRYGVLYPRGLRPEEWAAFTKKESHESSFAVCNDLFSG